MTTETKVKRNTNYESSAVNLNNPPEVKELLEGLLAERQVLSIMVENAQCYIPKEIKDQINRQTEKLAELDALVKGAIELHGSYQDTESGHYALKQRKVSVSYNAERFEYLYPQYSPAIIIKAVDATKLKGLIKGGLLTDEALKAGDVAKESESFVYIIR